MGNRDSNTADPSDRHMVTLQPAIDDDGRLIRIVIAGQGHAYEPSVKVILVLWVGLLALIGWLFSIGLWRQSRLASTVG